MASTSQIRRVPSEERVFSLVLALVASPQGLTKSDLLSSVYGYADRYDPAHPDPALERQFERDKTQVRQLGIPIETIDSPLEQGNNQLTRYRISKDRLQLPDTVRFTADELTLLKLASLAWRDGSLNAESRWATMKLTALGVNLDVRQLGIAPRIGILEPAAPVLQLAIDEGRVVRFDYQLPRLGAGLARRVAPLQLHRADGRWHLIGYDLERSADRVFLLSRISSEVRIEPDAYDPTLSERVAPALAQLLQLRQQQRATVRVQRGSEAEARLATAATAAPGADPVADTVLMEVGTLDLPILATELAGFGEQAQAVSPDQLRADVVQLLHLVRTQHGDGDYDH